MAGTSSSDRSKHAQEPQVNFASMDSLHTRSAWPCICSVHQTNCSRLRKSGMRLVGASSNMKAKKKVLGSMPKTTTNFGFER
jgi:hypothetical protein